MIRSFVYLWKGREIAAERRYTYILMHFAHHLPVLSLKRGFAG